MDGTYAPQSPDLSSFISSPPKTQQRYHPQSVSATYAPRSPVIPSFGNPPPQTFIPYPTNASLDFDHFGPGGTYGGGYMPQIPTLPPSHSFPNHSPATASPYFPLPQQRITHKPNPSFDFDSPTLPTMSSRGQHFQAEASTSASSAMPARARNDPNPTGIEIKTKFPVARIKRIMQADEEVGKVAQVTPVAVNKALELFMIALVTGAADKAREKGGKKVSAQHLKAVVESSPEQFDFLAEIVGRVGDAQEGAGGEGKRKKTKNESEESSEEEKKPKKGRARKKKGDE